MGDVISLPQQARATARAASAPRAAAEILFFTGVRYQRMADPAPAGGRPRSDGGVGAKRKRKRG